MPSARNAEIHFAGPTEFANRDGVRFRFEADTVLEGEVAFFTTTLPTREVFDNDANALRVSFDFAHQGQSWVYENTLLDYELLWQDGERVVEHADIQPIPGKVHACLDSRDNSFYVLPDGSTRNIRIKYMGSTFEVMPQRTGLLVKCRHYDNSNFANYRTVYYSIPYQRLLFKRAGKPIYNRKGELEDWESQGESFVEVRRR